MKSTTNLKDIKDNMQEVGERIKGAFNRLSIPIEMLRRIPTATEPAGIYVSWVDFDEFIEIENKYARTERLDNTKLFRDLAGLWNSMHQVRTGLTNDLERFMILADQFSLAQAMKPEPAKPSGLVILPPDKPNTAEAPSMPAPNGITMDEMLEPKPKVKGKPVELMDEADDNESNEEDEDEDGEEE